MHEDIQHFHPLSFFRYLSASFGYLMYTFSFWNFQCVHTIRTIYIIKTFLNSTEVHDLGCALPCFFHPSSKILSLCLPRFCTILLFCKHSQGLNRTQIGYGEMTPSLIFTAKQMKTHRYGKCEHFRNTLVVRQSQHNWVS